MIKILIADDSIFMRKLLSDLFEEQPDFKVVGVAHNGKDAVEKTAQLSPDLLTMDVNMPVMDGLEALAIIKYFAFIVAITHSFYIITLVSTKKS